MSFFSFLKNRDFYKVDEIIQRLEKANLFDEDVKTLSSKKSFVLFKTDVQKTWILISKRYLYCVLDDIKADELIFKFRINLSSLQENDLDVSNSEKLHGLSNIPTRINLSIDNSIHPKGFGKVLLPNAPEWLYYSTSSFSTPSDIASEITEKMKQT